MEINKKYVCPKCGKEISYIRFCEGQSFASGITVFCKKCGSVVPLEIKKIKNI